MSGRAIAIMAAAIMGITSFATAQPIAGQLVTGPSPPKTPRIVLSIGGASMDPLHGDDYPEGPVVLGSVGVAVTPHLRVELELTHREAARSYVSENVFFYGGAAGIPGHADRSVFSEDTSDWTTGLGLVGRTKPRVLVLFGGGGVLFHTEYWRQQYRVTNCTPPIPPSGYECMERDDRRTTHDVGFHGHIGTDVPLGHGLAAFVAVRYEARADLGFGTFGIGAGLRVALR